MSHSLNHAVYDPGTDFIYAVDGGRIFKIDPDDGSYITSSVFFAQATRSDTYVAFSNDYVYTVTTVRVLVVEYQLVTKGLI